VKAVRIEKSGQTLELPGLGLGETLEVPPGVLPRKKERQLHTAIGALLFVVAILVVAVIFFAVTSNKEVVGVGPIPTPVSLEVQPPKIVIAPAVVEVAEVPAPKKEKPKEFLTLKVYLDQEEAGMNFTFLKKEFSMKRNLDFIRDWTGQVKEVVADK